MRSILIAIKTALILTQPYLVMICALLSGLFALGGGSLISGAGMIASAAFTVVLFILLNLAQARLLRVRQALKEYWSPGKLGLILPATMFGIIIGSLPFLTAEAYGLNVTGTPELDKAFRPAALAGTLLVVAWEELWFRGVFLNYCSRSVPELRLSLINGTMFMLIHFLNPAIDLITSGPALVLAGTLLTLCYLRLRTIWVPIGIHFGNNLTQSILPEVNEDGPFWVQDGYMGALVLLLAIAVVHHLVRLRRRIEQ